MVKTDRNFRISAARAYLPEHVNRAYHPEHPQQRPGFKFYKRCDIRDTAAYFNRNICLDKVETNIYTMEGAPGTFSEQPIE
eukprot:14356209-Heterocapsa_arctica.AAC.1